MQKITRFTADERENLTAYLDGELEEKAANEIEQKLTRSEVARREVDILARTYDMLSLLPRANASDEFSQKTMAVALQTDDPRFFDNSKRWLTYGRRAAFLAGWCAAIYLAGWVGYQITNRMIPDESRLLVEELPIIDDLDNYREIGDVDFLRQLQSSHIFQEEAEQSNAPPQ